MRSEVSRRRPRADQDETRPDRGPLLRPGATDRPLAGPGPMIVVTPSLSVYVVWIQVCAAAHHRCAQVVVVVGLLPPRPLFLSWPNSIALARVDSLILAARTHTGLSGRHDKSGDVPLLQSIYACPERCRVRALAFSFFLPRGQLSRSECGFGDQGQPCANIKDLPRPAVYPGRRGGSS